MTSEPAPPDLAAEAVGNTPDAVVVVDRGGLIRLWNGGAERIFGYTAAEATGASLDLIVPERLRQRHWEGFHRAVSEGTTHYGPDSMLAVPALRADGTQISVEFTVAFVGSGVRRGDAPDPASGPAGMVAVIRDVTERRRQERELRSRLAELEGGRSAAPGGTTGG